DGLDGALAILALVASQALFVTDREPAPPLAELVSGLRSVFPPVDSPGGRDQGVQAGQLAEVFHAGAVTGRLEFVPPPASAGARACARKPAACPPRQMLTGL